MPTPPPTPRRRILDGLAKLLVLLGLRKRDPYRLREEEMTPEEDDLVFPPDDGIAFQWGDTYIRHRDVSDKGGKYWRQNEDGSITEFCPPALRVRVATRCVSSAFEGCLLLEEGETARLELASEELAKAAERYFLDIFWTSRSIEARAEGRILVIGCILNYVFESRYFPARAE